MTIAIRRKERRTRLLLHSPRFGLSHEEKTQAPVRTVTKNRIASREDPDASESRESVSTRREGSRRDEPRIPDPEEQGRKIEPAAGDQRRLRAPKFERRARTLAPAAACLSLSVRRREPLAVVWDTNIAHLKRNVGTANAKLRGRGSRPQRPHRIGDVSAATGIISSLRPSGRNFHWRSMSVTSATDDSGCILLHRNSPMRSGRNHIRFGALSIRPAESLEVVTTIAATGVL